MGVPNRVYRPCPSVVDALFDCMVQALMLLQGRNAGIAIKSHEELFTGAKRRVLALLITLDAPSLGPCVYCVKRCFDIFLEGESGE